MFLSTLRRLRAAALFFLAVAGGPLYAADAPLPVVFVHGSSGSAQQFETHAMRFTSNGFPQSRLHAF